MARNKTSILPGSGTRTVYRDNGTIQNVYDLYRSNAYTHRVLRPDSVKTQPVDGFRSPTSWDVTDHHLPVGFDGNFRYITPYSYPESYTEVEGNTSTMWSPPPGNFELPGLNDRSRAEIKALLKIKDQRVNVATLVAEGEKTVKTISDRLYKLSHAALAVKRGRPSDALRILGYTGRYKGGRGRTKGSTRAFGSDWLELQYGWLPFLSDLEGLYEEHRKKYQSFGYVIGAKSRVATPMRSSSVLPGDVSSMGDLFSIRVEDKADYLTKVDIWYRVNNPLLEQATSAGLTNPAAVAWELLPFSFLIDWLVPIGDWMNALDATSGLDFLGGSLSQSVRASRVCSVLPNARGSSCNATSAEYYFQLKRSVYLASPIPGFYYKNPFSVGHGLNALALLRTIFGGR